MNSNTMLEAALNYLARDWSVIPVGRDKKPLIKWERYQSQRAPKELIESWFTKEFPDANIGIVTGAISGIVVVDVEAGGETKDLPPTVISNTGGGGWHFVYKHPGYPTKNAVRIFDKTDIRADGGYIVAPPSIHSSGKAYEWAVSPDQAEFAEFPEWIIQKLDDIPEKMDWTRLLNTKILKGSRNNTATQVAGKLLHELDPAIWELSGWEMLKHYNQNNLQPSLPEQELRDLWDSIKMAEIKKRGGSTEPAPTSRTEEGGRHSQSSQLIKIIEDNDKITLFHDENNDPFASMPISDHKEIWRIKSRQFKRWLSKLYWDQNAKAVNSDALNTALTVIEAKACFNGKSFKLSNRVAWNDDAIWYDLTDEAWRTVKITPEGWKIVKEPPILFRHYSHQRPQVEPIKNGDVKAFLKFINISDEGQKLLLLVYLVSCFIPEIPHPVVIFYGSQGVAKTTLLKSLRRLEDPSATDDLDAPRSPHELAQLLSHHWCVYLDNLSNLQDWLSDILCKAVTGMGFSKRELYSDDDDIIYNFKRCVGMTGINLVAAKSDLLERSLLFELEKIPDNKRRQEKEVLGQLQAESPQILGGIFDVISKAMAIKPTLQIDRLPRMADFTIWGCAITEALGHKKEEFIDAYYKNINKQNEEILGGSLIATAVDKFMDERGCWEGTPSQLLKELTASANHLEINTSQERDWPKAANTLSKRLNELKPNLDANGITFIRGTKNKGRIITLQKNVNNSVSTDDLLLSEPNKDIPKADDWFSDTYDQASPVSSPPESLNYPESIDGNDTDDNHTGILGE